MPGKEIIAVFKNCTNLSGAHSNKFPATPHGHYIRRTCVKNSNWLIKVPNRDQPKWWTHKVEKFRCQRAHDMRRQHISSYPSPSPPCQPSPNTIKTTLKKCWSHMSPPARSLPTTGTAKWNSYITSYPICQGHSTLLLSMWFGLLSGQTSPTSHFR